MHCVSPNRLDLASPLSVLHTILWQIALSLKTLFLQLNGIANPGSPIAVINCTL